MSRSELRQVEPRVRLQVWRNPMGLRSDSSGIAPLLLGFLVLLGFVIVSWVFLAQLFVWTLLALLGFVIVYALMKMPKGNKAAVIGVVVVFVIIAALAAGFLFAVGKADTATHVWDNGGWFGGGQYPASDPAKTPAHGELIRETQIVTAHVAGKDSETIAFAGRMLRTVNACILDDVQYRTFIDGTPYQNFDENVASGITIVGWVNIEAKTVRLTGPYTDSVFRVEVWTHCALFNNPYYKIASDEVNLISGIGAVNWVGGVNRDGTLYQIGEQACANWKVPYTSSEIDGKGWYLVAYHQGTAKTLISKYEIETLTGQKCIPITSAEFQTGSGCKNIITVELWSEIAVNHWDDAATIDFATLGPSLTLKTDKSEYTEGDTIHVTWNATPNPTTKLAIVKVTLRVGVNEPLEYDVTGLDAYDLSTEVLGATRTVRISVTAQDEGCRPAQKDIDVVVHRKGDVVPPGGLSWLVIALLIVGIVLLVLAFVPGIPPPLKVVFGIVGSVLLALAAWAVLA